MNYAHSLRSVVDFEFYEFFKLLSPQMDVGSLGACADGSIGTRSASGSGPNSAAFGASGTPKPRTRTATGGTATGGTATGAKAIANRPHDRNPVCRTGHIESAENPFEHEDYRRPAIFGADCRG